MFEKVENFLATKLTALNTNRYMEAIKSGFYVAMPMLIIGSIFLLLCQLPIEGYSDFMAKTFGDGWSNFFYIPFFCSVSMMSLFVLLGVSESLSNYYKIDRRSSQAMAVAGFMILTPFINSETGATGIPLDNLGASGLFLTMIVAIAAVEMNRFVLKRGWVIKMPEGVPANVSASFTSLIPALLFMLICVIIRIGFAMTSFGSAHNFIYSIIQLPFQHLTSSLPTMILIVFMISVSWFFGIQPAIITSIFEPAWRAMSSENLVAFQAGMKATNIINFEFYANFIAIGGGGATIGLALALLWRKSKRYKELGKLSLPASIFNINEPLIFGVPIVLNPVIIIPFFLAPLICCVLTYVSMSIGLVSVANGLSIPWTTPPIISGYLLSGISGAVLQVIEIIISAAIYTPFLRILDKKALEEENTVVE